MTRRFGIQLAAELEDLDKDQSSAVLHPGNVALTAGPGSGKTRTLVARAAYLIEREVSPFRRVGCITYARPAAREIAVRIAGFGRNVGSRSTSRTFHSFCLNEILRPYAALGGNTPPSRSSVLGKASAEGLWQHCFDQIGIPDLVPKWREGELTSIRRAAASGDSFDSFDEREVRASLLFEKILLERGMLDYEAMVSRSLDLVQRSAQTRDLFGSRFPHLLVDEYQDLGGVLHKLVEFLRVNAGVTIFAVGDVDQSLYGFNGADPKFLNELCANGAYEAIALSINYRTAPNLLPLFSATLGEERGRIGAPDKSQGRYELVHAEGGLEAHAAEAIKEIERLTEEGVPPHRIAVLYPSKGPLLDSLLRALSDSRHPYLHGRDETLPSSQLFDVIRACAVRLNRLGTSIAGDPEPSLEEIADRVHELRLECELSPMERRPLLKVLCELVDGVGVEQLDGKATPWVEGLVTGLALERIWGEAVLDAHVVAKTEIVAFIDHAISLRALADNLDATNKILLTTYHSAKGLGFDSVILPGLVDGVSPKDVKYPTGRWGPPTGDKLEEARRAFYVAVTRAERSITFIYGTGFSLSWGWKSSQPSVFLREMHAFLESAEPQDSAATDARRERSS